MSLLEKQCPDCKQVLPVEMFSKNKSKRNGLHSHCKACDGERRRNWYAKTGKQWTKDYAKANPVMIMTQSMVGHARGRAKDKNLPFDIDLDYVRSMVGENAELASHCPALGVPLDWSRMRNNGGKHLPNSPSIDRIDPERGYVKGNIKIISYRANQIKSDASHQELKLVTAYLGRELVNSLEF
jgi:hypothetical protein